MRSRQVLLVLAAVCGLVAMANTVRATIIVPAYLAANSNYTALIGTPDRVVNGSGLSADVLTGDTLVHAQSVTHVANDSAFDNTFLAYLSPTPTLVWDLGTNVKVDNVVLWNCEYGNGDQWATQTFALRFATAAAGPTSFSGAAAYTGSPLPQPPGTGSTEPAYTFSLSGVSAAGVARYVELKLTNNYSGVDYIGLGELRFDASPTPEPSTMTLLAMGLISLLAYAWRKRR